LAKIAINIKISNGLRKKVEENTEENDVSEQYKMIWIKKKLFKSWM